MPKYKIADLDTEDDDVIEIEADNEAEAINKMYETYLWGRLCAVWLSPTCVDNAYHYIIEDEEGFTQYARVQTFEERAVDESEKMRARRYAG